MLLSKRGFEVFLIPELKPNQVVILDNASFHRKAKLKKLLKKAQCRLLALPPYSPDLNKIEQLWHRIKTLVSHNLETIDFHSKVNQAFCSL